MERSFNAEIVKASDDPAKYQSEIRQFEEKVFAVISEKMAWDNMKPKFIAIYDETFTEKELGDIVAFYKSPSGQKLIESTPTLMAKGGQVGQEAMAGAVPEIQKMSEDFMQNILKKAQGQEKK